MPFYEYQCEACGAHHEAMQKMSDAPLRKCPACGRQKLKRLVSAPVFRLKGGGWYETDFKSDAEAKRNLHGEDKADKPAAEASPASPASEAKEAAPADKGTAGEGAKAGAAEKKTAGESSKPAPKPRPKAAARRPPGSRGRGTRRR